VVSGGGGGGGHGGSADRRHDDAGDGGGGRAGGEGECVWGGGRTDVTVGPGAGWVGGRSGFDPTRDKEELAAVIISQFSPQVCVCFRPAPLSPPPLVARL
jgi:hypothetical protein